MWEHANRRQSSSDQVLRMAVGSRSDGSDSLQTITSSSLLKNTPSPSSSSLLLLLLSFLLIFCKSDRCVASIRKWRRRRHRAAEAASSLSQAYLGGVCRGSMSDDDHHFDSKADAGASKTFPQQAGTIRKNAHIVIKQRPCKVVEVSTSKTGKHGHAKCHFVAIDIFTGKKLEDIVPSSHNCDVPEVIRTDYQLIDISEDGFVSLLTDNGETKDDLRLPTDDQLLSQIKAGFGEGKDLVVTVMSAMGEEQICALKDIGPK